MPVTAAEIPIIEVCPFASKDECSAVCGCIARSPGGVSCVRLDQSWICMHGDLRSQSKHKAYSGTLSRLGQKTPKLLLEDKVPHFNILKTNMN